MAFVSIVTHKVMDYAAWKKVCDSVKGVQTKAGVRAHSALRARRRLGSMKVSYCEPVVSGPL